jgi:hypothetical protein
MNQTNCGPQSVGYIYIYILVNLEEKLRTNYFKNDQKSPKSKIIQKLEIINTVDELSTRRLKI